MLFSQYHSVTVSCCQGLDEGSNKHSCFWIPHPSWSGWPEKICFYLHPALMMGFAKRSCSLRKVSCQPSQPDPLLPSGHYMTCGFWLVLPILCACLPSPPGCVPVRGRGGGQVVMPHTLNCQAPSSPPGLQLGHACMVQSVGILLSPMGKNSHLRALVSEQILHTPTHPTPAHPRHLITRACLQQESSRVFWLQCPVLPSFLFITFHPSPPPCPSTLSPSLSTLCWGLSPAPPWGLPPHPGGRCSPVKPVLMLQLRSDSGSLGGREHACTHAWVFVFVLLPLVYVKTK